MTTPLAFVDVESTGLDPYYHEIWEVGLILRNHHAPDGAPNETEFVWQLPVDLAQADPIALNIGRFHERRGDTDCTPLDVFARTFAGLTRDAHLVGACISFDAERLWRLLRRNGECPMWHYHIVDVEALAAGWLAAQYRPRQVITALDVEDPSTVQATINVTPIDPAPPWDSGVLSRAVGVDSDQVDRHTALGDAKWARAIYDAVMGAPK